MEHDKRISVLLIAISVGLMMMAPIAYADNIQAGNWIKLYNGHYGTTSGGEFEVFKSNGNKYGTYNDQDFTTFCMESNENISYGDALYVAGINKHADGGGSGGSVGGQDPLDPRTAYLYYNFRIGYLDDLTASLSTKWTYSNTGIDDLQKAIWFIEEENGGSDNYLVTLATGSEWAKNKYTGNVYVMNLTDGDPNHRKQDQLVLASVPEPGTMLLLGLGLMGVATIRKKMKE